MFRNVQIPIKWKYSVESHIIPRLRVFEEIRSYYETQIIYGYGLCKVSYYKNIMGKTNIFPYYGLWMKIYWIKKPTQFPDMGN